MKRGQSGARSLKFPLWWAVSRPSSVRGRLHIFISDMWYSWRHKLRELPQNFHSSFVSGKERGKGCGWWPGTEAGAHPRVGVKVVSVEPPGFLLVYPPTFPEAS